MPRRGSQTRAVALGVGATVFGLGLLVLVSWLTSRGDVDVRLGPSRFDAGNVERMAAEIDERGPIPYQDPASRGRDIYLHHVGDEVDEGWVAVGALAPGQDDRSCALRPDDDGFVDPCTERRYPADGDGLTTYDTEVEDGRLWVDLRSSGSG
jgi:hypothetical protein